MGGWWADGVAALFIAVEITRDGVKNMRRVVADLMDSRPTTVNGQQDEAPARLRERIRTVPWVQNADVRLREEGHVFTGEIYVVPKGAVDDLPRKVEELAELAREVDWRIYDVVVMPVTTLDG